MKIFTTYKSERGKHQINRGLLWEYRMEDFDWQKYRKVVAERVISMGQMTGYHFDFEAIKTRIVKMTDYPDKVYATAPLKRLR